MQEESLIWAESQMRRLEQLDQEDEDSKSLEEAYESLLEAYQEARALNEELTEMIKEYISMSTRSKKETPVWSLG